MFLVPSDCVMILPLSEACVWFWTLDVLLCGSSVSVVVFMDFSLVVVLAFGFRFFFPV